jgi:histidinol-phosphatase
MLDPILSDWDCAALLPILEEAGGRFTDWSGRRTTHGKSGISTNGKVTAELQGLLGQ